jgi:hypothetical protein
MVPQPKPPEFVDSPADAPVVEKTETAIHSDSEYFGKVDLLKKNAFGQTHFHSLFFLLISSSSFG